MFDFEFKSQLPDIDPAETQDWIDSLTAVLERHGKKRARFILQELVRASKMYRVGLPVLVQSDYINTIAPEEQPPYPGNERVEKRIRRLVRWNAAVMVVRGNKHSRAWAGTFPPTRPPQACTRSASTTSSRARTTRVAATRSTSRGTRPRESMRAPSWRGVSAAISSSTSGARPRGRARDWPPIRIRG